MQLNEESLEKKLKDKDKEITELKNLNYGLQNKVTSLNEIIYKKDKEISSIVYEKDMGMKAFEESQMLVKELRGKENELIKENKELREINEFAEEERKHFEKELEEAAGIIERMKRTLALKEETILSLHKSRSMDKDFRYASDGLKSEDYDRKKEKQIKIFERRFTNSPEKNEHGLTERSEDVSYKIMCHEAMKIVGITSTKDFYSKLVHLRQHHSRYKKSRRLIDKITDMIVQCSPSGSFSKEPNTHQIWKWITGLLEEYMKIKKSLSGEAFLKLCHILDTDDVEVMINRVTHLVRARSPKKIF